MWDWLGRMGGWWWLAVPMMIAFWTLIVWGVVVLLRRSGPRYRAIDNDARDRGAGSAPSASDILKERNARGKIDSEEYDERLGAELHSRPQPATADSQHLRR